MLRKQANSRDVTTGTDIVRADFTTICSYRERLSVDEGDLTSAEEDQRLLDARDARLWGAAVKRLGKVRRKK
jgi:hypothetical protein